MPIPWIVGGLIIGGAALLGKASQEVAHDNRVELNEINDQIKRTARNANNRLEESQEAWKQSIERLVKSRKELLEIAITPFYEEVKHIKADGGLPIVEKDIEMKELSAYVSGAHTNYTGTSLSSFGKNTGVHIAAAALMGPVASGALFLGGMVDFVRTEFKKDEANEQLAKVESKAAELDLISAGIETIAEFYGLFDVALWELYPSCESAIDEVKRIRNTYGDEYRTYPSEEKKNLRAIANLMKTMFEILKYGFINEDGTPNIALLDKTETPQSFALPLTTDDKERIVKASNLISQNT